MRACKEQGLTSLARAVMRAEFISPKEQLQRERKAVTILRGLLYTQPAVRQDLRQVPWSTARPAADTFGTRALHAVLCPRTASRLVTLHT